MDVFQELHAEQDAHMNEYIDTFFKDLEEMWGTRDAKDTDMAKEAIYCDPWSSPTPPSTPPTSPTRSVALFTGFPKTLPASSKPVTPHPQLHPQPRYLAPTSSYSRIIWDQCGFRVKKGERKITIERGLAVWADQHQLTYVGSDGLSWISWKVNGTFITGRWSAFVLWFLCTCTKVDPPSAI